MARPCHVKRFRVFLCCGTGGLSLRRGVFGAYFASRIWGVETRAADDRTIVEDGTDKYIVQENQRIHTANHLAQVRPVAESTVGALEGRDQDLGPSGAPTGRGGCASGPARARWTPPFSRDICQICRTARLKAGNDLARRSSSRARREAAATFFAARFPVPACWAIRANISVIGMPPR
ncbi:hypothetical protein MESS2_1580006 [Mesorhizobium metallidurans STM 2683]|uniref:Uncharacterized protein n=1 Tax=Mesorhizobium metallidurans STM 2683 TaxID=1297569 RepID=M5EME0_9HYPH|nr:hypothetical protein MESS2_1580006 [Mesorhizobium metallidurans STM 2683]